MEITSGALDRLASNTGTSTDKVAQTYSDFLRLLTTQLQHQDPLDPTDTNEFTNQLVQFSQVEQQISSNQKFDVMLQLQNNSLATASIGYIGKDVFYRGDTVANEGDALKVGYTMDASPASAKLRIVDEDKVTVRTFELPAGTSTGNIEWDGKDDNGVATEHGVYSIQIDALDADGKSITTYAGVPARVVGVETIDGTVYLALNGDRQVRAIDVLSVSMPATTPTTPTT